MKKFLILFLVAAARFSYALAPMSPDEAKAWLIQYFQIPADAEISLFLATDNPVKSVVISWDTGGAVGNPMHHAHSRIYDFEKQIVTYQYDH
jgi:hypothetical protein